MVSPETTNWIYYPTSAEQDGSIADSDGRKETGSKKRERTEPCSGTSSKACREKLRRDKLNDKFLELASILEPGKPPKNDKAAILVDAVRKLAQLRNEAQKLKDSNTEIQENIKEMKTEKTELRDEKQRLKAVKEDLEQKLKSMNTQPSFMIPPPGIQAAYPAAIAAAQCQTMGNKVKSMNTQPSFMFPPPGIQAAYPAAVAAAQGQTMGNKLVPVVSYPGMAMWQFMPPAAVDTSQDHVLRPPVA